MLALKNYVRTPSGSEFKYRTSPQFSSALSVYWVHTDELFLAFCWGALSTNLC